MGLRTWLLNQSIMKIQSSPQNISLSRRSLLKVGWTIGAAGVLGSFAPAAWAAPGGKLKKGDVILFQGDSITDAGRKKDRAMANDSDALGKSYAAMIAGELLAEYPDLDLQCYNRGISGNKVPDLAARWDTDAIALKPAILSIHIGVNDLWHTVAFGSKYKGTIDDYETGYRELIKRSQKEIPGVRIIVCEPFELRDWPALDPYRAVARKLADEMKLTFVPFHAMFQEAAKTIDKKFWAWDGIHPTIPGHTLMRKAWRQAVGV
jgi:lysophospholipase L1-like esterase